MLNVPPRPLARNSIFVPENENALVVTEEAVDVLEGAVGGLGVEEVDDGDKGGVEEGPDDVEFPLEGLDAYGGDFDDWKRGSARAQMIREGNVPMKLKAQFDAVPRAAPLVLMLSELISVGYSQGTPCHPMPKKT